MRQARKTPPENHRCRTCRYCSFKDAFLSGDRSQMPLCGGFEWPTVLRGEVIHCEKYEETTS